MAEYAKLDRTYYVVIDTDRYPPMYVGRMTPSLSTAKGTRTGYLRRTGGDPELVFIQEMELVDRRILFHEAVND